ncbi:hypothetical protein D910_05269, partial [Dendroctonus ponderosae]
MPTSERTLSKYRSIFEQCDTDQNNLICLAELTAFLRSKGHTNDLSDEKVSYVFKLANRDGDKTLNFDEFVYMLEHPDLQHLFGHYMNNYVNFLIPQHKEKPVRVVPKGRSIRVGYAKTAATQVGLQRRISIESTEISLFVKEDEDIVYGDQYTCCPPPLAILLITLLELAFFIVDESTEDPAVGEIGKTAQVFMYEPSKRHEAWRFLTYMFVHIGYLHIIVNLVIQLVLGVPLEMVHKWWRVLLLYFAGVIAGSLATSITDPRVRLAGASGGVYCLLTAHIATIIMVRTGQECELERNDVALRPIGHLLDCGVWRFRQLDIQPLLLGDAGPSWVHCASWRRSRRPAGGHLFAEKPQREELRTVLVVGGRHHLWGFDGHGHFPQCDASPSISGSSLTTNIELFF